MVEESANNFRLTVYNFYSKGYIYMFVCIQHVVKFIKQCFCFT